VPYVQLDSTLAAAAPTTNAGAPLTSLGDTLADFRSDLIQELGNRSDLAGGVDRYINKAYKYLCSVLTIKETFAEVLLNLVADQSLYNIPNSVAWVRSLSIQDTVNYPVAGGAKLVPMDLDEYRKLPDDTVNLPGNYFREQRIIGIYPTPRASYNVIMNFKVRPDPLVNDTDSPILPVDFHETLLLRAKHTAFRALKDYVAAGIARNDMVTDLRSIENTDAMEQGEIPSGIRPIRRASQLNDLDRSSKWHSRTR
jgi:hypothetical protein